MSLLLALVSLPPLATLALQGRRGWARAEWARVGLLTLVGLFISGPLLRERALGAGDAANYAHAVADTAVQLRAGVFPVFVGQSIYAFNGRIHPLRTAPYYNYAAGFLDLVTAHRLNFWGLQNGLLALSLMGGLFSAYICLRRLGSVGPWAAAGLAALYALSPGLLACAYGQDLYMTVTTAPFLPVALLGALRGFAQRTFRNYGIMAAGLAALWLAHPPVAAWISVGCAGLLAVSWLTRPPTWRAAGALGAAGLAGLILSGYAFVSALSVDHQVANAVPRSFKALSVDALQAIVREHWVASLRPLALDGITGLGSFQLGYVLWILLLALLGTARRRGALGAALAAVLLFYLLLTLPVPGLSRPLWLLLPFPFITMTNIWPMQRAYLVLAAWTVFAGAWILPALPWSRWRRYRTIAVALGGAAALWSVGQAWPFVLNGYLNRQEADTSELRHRPENTNLTVTAYALLRPPTTFTSGTMDPEHEFSLIRMGDGRPLLDNWGVDTRATIVAQGRLRIAGGDRNALQLAPALTLAPGRRYVLRLKFLVPPFQGGLYLSGGTLLRDYPLPTYVGIHGFGMAPGNNPALPLWTTGDQPSVVHLRLSSGDPRLPVRGDLAEFTLEETDRAKLPIQLEQLVPELRCRVRAPEDAWLVTPRMYLRGYAASVDGHPAHAIESPEGMVLVAVPAGVHEVALRYEGFPLLRVAFYTTLLGWVVGLGGLAAGAVRPHARAPRPRASDRMPKPSKSPNRRVCHPVAVAATAVLLLTGLGLAIAAPRWWRAHRPPSAGPIQLRFWLPLARMGDLHYLITADQAPRTSAVFVRYVDSGHIQVGLDAKYRGYAISAPIPVAYRQLQTLTVTTGAYYPEDDPALAGQSPAELAWLRGTVRMWLNGHEVLTRQLSDYYPGDPHVVITSERTGGPTVLNGFTGTVVASERLPIAAAGCPFGAAETVRRGAGPIRLRLALPPDRLGQREPVLLLGTPGDFSFVYLRYVDAAHVQIGMELRGLAPAATAPLAVDYGQPHEVTISVSALYPAAHPEVAALPAEERAWLRSHLRIQFDGQTALALRGEMAPTPAGAIVFPQEAAAAAFLPQIFNGVLLGLERRPIAESGYLPAQADWNGRRAGAVRIKLTLPLRRAGRSEPLLTAGVPGHALFLFLRYVDATHLRVGLDLWGSGLLAYGDPVAFDPAHTQEFSVTAGSLYPLDDPGVAALSAAERARLRGLVEVTLNGRVIFSRRVTTPDVPPATVTVGESRIGGSNTEAFFTGDILSYERLPPPTIAGLRSP